MAAGDVVSGINTGAAGAAITFQPAVGVEVRIFFCTGLVGVNTAAITNGTQTSEYIRTMEATTQLFHAPVFYLNNSIYLSLGSGGTTINAYTGIQTK